MFLQKIHLANFRSYSDLKFTFKSPITVLIGNNAQGKTNFLESVYFLATAKATRAERDEELIKEGETTLRVEGGLETDTKLEIAMQLVEESLTKRVKVNGVPRRVADYSQNLAVSIFAPEDINLVTGSPSLRRNHVDQVLSQVDKEYKRTLSRYEEVVTKKNKVLKAIREHDASMDQLIFWLEQQVSLGQIIQEKRALFFDFLNQAEKKLGDFEYGYKENSISLERLREYQGKEIDSASSLIGPHRDDFSFILERRDLSKYGSRAQQRTGVLDLKMAELVFMENSLGDRPLLLLDDIFSELDLDHRKHVLELAKLQQTIITTVEMDELLKDQVGKSSQIVKVNDSTFTI